MAFDPEIIERVRTFVAEQTGYPLKKTALDTRLAWDIGLAGDDAIEFFEHFSRAFDVDVESLRSLDFRKHFGDEGMGPEGCLLGVLVLALMTVLDPLGLPWCFSSIVALALLYLFGIAWCKYLARKNRHNKSLVMVSDLVEAAHAKRWVASK